MVRKREASLENKRSVFEGVKRSKKLRKTREGGLLNKEAACRTFCGLKSLCDWKVRENQRKRQSENGAPLKGQRDPPDSKVRWLSVNPQFSGFAQIKSEMR